MTLAEMPNITPSSLIGEGRLADAVAAVTAAVKARPSSVTDRILLAELLLLEGSLERADAQLQLASDHGPAELVAITHMRQLLRAAAARAAWYREGAVPAFVGEPNERQRDAMRLALAVRAGTADEAARLRLALESRDLVVARCDGEARSELRDACDLSQHGLEALALDGRYLWLALENVAEMRFAPVRRPSDLFWRRTETRLRDGRNVTFFIPAQYFDPEATDLQRLAQATDWVETVGGVVRGRGQRTLLLGEDGKGLMDITQLVVEDAH